MTPAARSVAALFALSGWVSGSFYTRLPAIKAHLDVNAGRLSLALFGLTAGLVAAQPLTAKLIGRRGSGPVAIGGGVLACAAVIGPGLAGSLGVLVCAGVLLGVTSGTLDTAMNVHGVAVERADGRPILSRLHATYSLGVLAGAGVGGVMAAAGVGVRAHLIGAALVGAAMLWAATPRLGPGEQPAPAAHRRQTRSRASAGGKRLAEAGAIAFCVLLCEGAVSDWSAVHLRDTLGLSPGAAALGLAAFSVAMIVGRLNGDRVTVALGARARRRAEVAHGAESPAAVDGAAVARGAESPAAVDGAAVARGAESPAAADGAAVAHGAESPSAVDGAAVARGTEAGTVAHLRLGGAIAGAGLLLAALAPDGALAIAGFTAAGLGLSALFPLVIRAASSTAAPATAIATVTAAGYAGLVTGPAAVGALASVTSLRASLALILGTLCVVTVLLAPSARR